MDIDSMVPERNEEIAWSELEEEIVLLDIEGGSYYSLNEVSAFVWKRIDGARSIGDLVDEVLEEYEAAREQVRDDVIRLIGDLSQKNILFITTKQTGP